MDKILQTNFLCSDSSFTSGMGSVFNIAGNFYDYNYSNTSSDADISALKSDWANVGNDIYSAMDTDSE